MDANLHMLQIEIWRGIERKTVLFKSGIVLSLNMFREKKMEICL